MGRGFRGFRREVLPKGIKKTQVTYWVDVGLNYVEDVEQDQTVLSPKTFIPSKSGYTFLGWREDTIASADVLTDKVAEGDTLTLYAVFRQAFTLSMYNGSSTPTQSTYYQYYNNGNVVNPTATLTQIALGGDWVTRGWSTAASGTTVNVNNGGTVTLTANATYYGLYSKTVTVSYAANGGSGSTAASTGTAYWHSYAGGTNASITLRACGFTRTSPYAYNFSKWALNSASGTQYAAGATISLINNATMYAVWTMQGVVYTPANIASWGWSFTNEGGTKRNYNSYVRFEADGEDGSQILYTVPASSYRNYRVYVRSSSGPTIAIGNSGTRVYSPPTSFTYYTYNSAVVNNCRLLLTIQNNSRWLDIAEVYLY